MISVSCRFLPGEAFAHVVVTGEVINGGVLAAAEIILLGPEERDGMETSSVGWDG